MFVLYTGSIVFVQMKNTTKYVQLEGLSYLAKFYLTYVEWVEICLLVDINLRNCIWPVPNG